MFRSTLKLPVETPENPFIAPTTLEYIQPFMKIVGYQRDVDKTKINILQIFHDVVNHVNVDYAEFDSIHMRLEEDYHSIKDDIPLVGVYTTGNVIVRWMLILDEFLTDDICAIEEYKEYEKVFVGVDVPTIQSQPVKPTQGTNRIPSAHRPPTPTTIVGNVVQKKRNRKQVAEETSSPKPSLKIRVKKMKPSITPIPPPNDDRERDEIVKATLLSVTMYKTAITNEAQENVAKVQEKLMEVDIAKMVDGEDKDSYASEFADLVFQDDDDDFGNRIEPVIHKENPEAVDDNEKEKNDEKKDDDNDDHTNHALFKTQFSATVLPTPGTTSQGHSKSTFINTKVLSGSIVGMSRRHGKIRKHLKTTFVTNEYFWEKMREIFDLLKNLVLEITVLKTNEMIKEPVPRLVDLVVKRDREIALTNEHELISKEFATHAPRIIEELF
uniref:Uncharacterized protein n=1 Tax=Tanacetum cinerariifolium TaxID=118510 RepID=A0A699IZA8_TANCI|nr:hypothetical protein [Tanacetum cinerariifolium]